MEGTNEQALPSQYPQRLPFEYHRMSQRSAIRRKNKNVLLERPSRLRSAQVEKEKPRISRRRTYLLLGLPLSLVGMLCVTNNSTLSRSLRRGKRSIVDMKCPLSEGTSFYMEAQEESSSYNERSRTILSNITGFLENFRESKFDGWSTYNSRKEKMREWKATRFNDIPDGGAIYESACGIGLNLYMTLEVLQEIGGPKNLVVYGNDYVGSSVDVARQITKHLPNGGKQGALCQSDSTKIPHVPSDSFDLVFTGFIAAVWNPLNLTVGTLDDDEDEYDKLGEMYLDFCQNDSKMDERRRAQEIQDKWYFRWVAEMVRIAKPGASVIAEQIAPPRCDAPNDFGGVSKDFWKENMKKWGMREESLDIMEMPGGRYNVKMTKQ